MVLVPPKHLDPLVVPELPLHLGLLAVLEPLLRPDPLANLELLLNPVLLGGLELLFLPDYLVVPVALVHLVAPGVLKDMEMNLLEKWKGSQLEHDTDPNLSILHNQNFHSHP
ncbi:hypothetical protein [Rossellomorea marisflavi]|uniref:hypothetical protein n=1 Tax=Rossellomorea marisflavi TaxID=189381 RepID=UPI001CA3BD16|nr:hypothetical protein K6T23_10940 [Rossellomorea marisflavi]